MGSVDRKGAGQSHTQWQHPGDPSVETHVGLEVSHKIPSQGPQSS